MLEGKLMFELFLLYFFLAKEVEVHDRKEDGQVEGLDYFQLGFDDLEGERVSSHYQFLLEHQAISRQGLHPHLDLLAIFVPQGRLDLFQSLEGQGEEEGHEVVVVLGVDRGFAEDSHVLVPVKDLR